MSQRGVQARYHESIETLKRYSVKPVYGETGNYFDNDPESVGLLHRRRTGAHYGDPGEGFVGTAAGASADDIIPEPADAETPEATKPTVNVNVNVTTKPEETKAEKEDGANTTASMPAEPLEKGDSTVSMHELLGVMKMMAEAQERFGRKGDREYMWDPVSSVRQVKRGLVCDLMLRVIECALLCFILVSLYQDQNMLAEAKEKAYVLMDKSGVILDQSLVLLNNVMAMWETTVRPQTQKSMSVFNNATLMLEEVVNTVRENNVPALLTDVMDSIRSLDQALRAFRNADSGTSVNP